MWNDSIKYFFNSNCIDNKILYIIKLLFKNLIIYIYHDTLY